MRNMIMVICPMNFPTQLVRLRKDKGFTQQTLAKAVSQFDPAEKRTIKELLEGMIIKHEARRWSRTTSDLRETADAR